MFRLIGAILLLACFSSCNGNDEKAFEDAAGEICDCMAEAKRQNTELSEVENDLNLNQDQMNYSICAMHIGDIDMADKQMRRAIEKKCPQLLDQHDEFVRKTVEQ